MNEKFGHADFSNPANYFQTSYAAQHVIRAEVASATSAPHIDLNSNDSTPSVIFNASRINENSATSHAPSSASAANIFSPNSVHTWNESEQRFHDHFYSGGNEATLTDLTLVKQGKDESVNEYFIRFKDVKDRCFNLSISERDIARLALGSLCCHFKEKLEGYDDPYISQLYLRAPKRPQTSTWSA